MTDVVQISKEDGPSREEDKKVVKFISENYTLSAKDFMQEWATAIRERISEEGLSHDNYYEQIWRCHEHFKSIDESAWTGHDIDEQVEREHKLEKGEISEEEFDSFDERLSRVYRHKSFAHKGFPDFKKFMEPPVIDRDMLERAVSDYLVDESVQHNTMDYMLLDMLIYQEYSAFAQHIYVRLGQPKGNTQLMKKIMLPTFFYRKKEKRHDIEILEKMKDVYRLMGGPIVNTSFINQEVQRTYKEGIGWPNALLVLADVLAKRHPNGLRPVHYGGLHDSFIWLDKDKH